MVVTRPGDPRRAFAHRNEAAYDNHRSQLSALEVLIYCSVESLYLFDV